MERKKNKYKRIKVTQMRGDELTLTRNCVLYSRSGIVFLHTTFFDIIVTVVASAFIGIAVGVAVSPLSRSTQV